jgi:hypothetical protein
MSKATNLAALGGKLLTGGVVPDTTVNFTPAGLGAVVRTIQSKMRETVSITDFGGLPGSGNAASNDAAMTSAISWLSANGGELSFPAGDYYFTAGFIIPDGCGLRGLGGGYVFGYRTKLIFSGTGTKSYAIPGATATVIANPRAGEAYLADSGTRGDNYSTLDLTANFSAAIVLGKGSSLEDMGIHPNLSGVTGYAGSDGAMSDEWDVGVYCRNADSWRMKNVSVAGHWRKAAKLLSHLDIGDGQIPSSQFGQAEHCWFQGYRGLAIRTAETDIGSGFGFAGTDYVNCVFRSLNHQSIHLATSSALDVPFASPSGCREISGFYVRGVQFLNCTDIGRDDICAIFDQAREILHLGCYQEGQNVRVSGPFLPNGTGISMVATANAVNIDFSSNTKFGVDFTPYQARDGSLSGQRYTAAGVYNPLTANDDDYSEQKFASQTGPRLRSTAQGWRVLAADDSVPLQVDAFGNTVASRFGSGLTESVADDTAVSVVPPKNGGVMAITFTGGSENSGFPSGAHSGLIFYDVGAGSPEIAKWAGGPSFDVVGTDVTGTTGTDGRVTIGIIAGNIRIENRQGGASPLRYTFLA